MLDFMGAGTPSSTPADDADQPAASGPDGRAPSLEDTMPALHASMDGIPTTAAASPAGILPNDKPRATSEILGGTASALIAVCAHDSSALDALGASTNWPVLLLHQG